MEGQWYDLVHLLPSFCCPVVSRSFPPFRSEFTDSILSVHPSDVLDMPVDPNEPTYCLCHQVSYGEMIGCDNPDVSASFFFSFVFVFLDRVSLGNLSIRESTV